MFDAKHGDIRNGHGSDFKDGRHCFRTLITAAVREKETT